LIQRCAVEKLHRDEMPAVLLTNVVNVGVIQCGCGLCFAAEAFESRGIVKQFGGQEIQSYRTRAAFCIGELGLVGRRPLEEC